VGDMFLILAPIRGFSMSANLTVIVNFLLKFSVTAAVAQQAGSDPASYR